MLIMYISQILKVMLAILVICTQAYSTTQQLRHGASVFMEYCIGCHSLQAVRYQQLRKDLAIDTLDIAHLRSLHLPSQPSDLYTSLSKKDARNWFASVPPDLSMIALILGKKELKQYLYGFYPDVMRNFGSANNQRPGINMPDVLAPLRQDREKLDSTIDDLIEFLEYTADPSITVRTYMGILLLCIIVIIGFVLINYAKLIFV